MRLQGGEGGRKAAEWMMWSRDMRVINSPGSAGSGVILEVGGRRTAGIQIRHQTRSNMDSFIFGSA